MPGLEVADIFRRHGEGYRQAHVGHLGRTERRIMGAIEAFRTAVLGGHAECCTDCGLVRVADNSCRNRHCPKCQGLARATWLADRQAELLPAPYFHVVFTVPAAVAAIAFQNKATVYAILFRAAAETLRTIAADPRHLGAEIGVVAVLHSWGQNLQPHPHIHVSSPAAAYRRTERAGSPAGRASSFRSASSLACSGGCSSSIYRQRFQTCHSSPSGLDWPTNRAFDRGMAELRRVDCRVDGGVAVPIPHRPGRADFPHPVLHERGSLAAA